MASFAIFVDCLLSMIIYKNIEEVNLLHPVVTIGFFDGLHLGHSTIIDTVIKKSKKHNTPSLLITFWPHPRLVLGKDADKLRLLSTIEEKQQLIQSKGVDGMLTIDFTPEFAKISAHDFLSEILIKKLGASAIVLGYNHVFGHDGQGDFNLVKQHQAAFGYEATRVHPVSLNGINVSSTKIRKALKAGNLCLANEMLNRPYSIAGVIEGGKQIGRSIGFPTANISPANITKQIPANGVYAVLVDYEKKSYPAMLNIGVKPTIGDGLKRTIEAHIIGFNKNIYSQKINIRFIKKIREEQKFESLSALQAQLIADKKTVLRTLTHKNQLI